MSDLPSTARVECPYLHWDHVCLLSFTHVSFPKALLATNKIKQLTYYLTFLNVAWNLMLLYSVTTPIINQKVALKGWFNKKAFLHCEWLILKYTILTTWRSRINLHETSSAISIISTSYDSSSQSNFAMPGYRMKSNISGSHWGVQIMPPFCMFIHIASKYFWFIMVNVFVKEPDWRIIGVWHWVRCDKTTSVSLALGD